MTQIHFASRISPMPAYERWCDTRIRDVSGLTLGKTRGYTKLLNQGSNEQWSMRTLNARKQEREKFHFQKSKKSYPSGRSTGILRSKNVEWFWRYSEVMWFMVLKSTCRYVALYDTLQDGYKRTRKVQGALLVSKHPNGPERYKEHSLYWRYCFFGTN